ncbi:hypothetical protein [Candidatus Absconditicoccus praedator]|uniref:hypothetical protein n=1 Tax=Candidatus Absconditicoccus praedator TaxID=2735562 RepID=UPI001E43C74D|nr:hypothetical protein [Candidatus Absconditicoccus praedator]UFX82580.1 hypothetical protein HLG78_00305 [Candidatus Absconditicoccus praedator]
MKKQYIIMLFSILVISVPVNAEEQSTDSSPLFEEGELEAIMQGEDQDNEGTLEEELDLDEESSDILDQQEEVEDTQQEEEVEDTQQEEEVEDIQQEEEVEDTQQEEEYNQEYIDSLNFTEIYNSYIYQNINELSDFSPQYQEKFDVINIEWIESNTARVDYKDDEKKYIGEIKLRWWNGSVVEKGYNSIKSPSEDITEETKTEEYLEVQETKSLKDMIGMSFEERNQIIKEKSEMLLPNKSQEFENIQIMIDTFLQNNKNKELLEQRLDKLKLVVEEVDQLNLSNQMNNLVVSTFLYMKNEFEQQIEDM